MGDENIGTIYVATGIHFNKPGHGLKDVRITTEDGYRNEREKYLINQFNTFYRGSNRMYWPCMASLLLLSLDGLWLVSLSLVASLSDASVMFTTQLSKSPWAQCHETDRSFSDFNRGNLSHLE